MKQPIWKPSEERIKNANMTRFIEFVNKRYNKKFNGYFELYDWSITDIADFWAAVWNFVGIKASKQYDRVVEDLSVFPGTKWFPGAELNFAENLLRYRDNKVAFIFKCETKPSVYITYEELYRIVGRLASALKKTGVKKGDRVVAYMPNMPETAIAMLAATSIGATWASCGSELGVQAVIDRFSQIEPKVLFTVDGYLYKNKPFQMLGDVKEVVESVPSLEKVVVVPYVGEKPDVSTITGGVLYKDFLGEGTTEEITFEQVPFNHPVCIMFSSGTTGKPKCMVQGVGGILLNHLKELIIHADLKRDDTIIYMTAPSWMMWNWLVSTLAVGSRVVLFDGNPGYPDLGTMWKLIDDEKITFFGTSATYINLLKSQGFKPKEKYNLGSLKSIGQTGSALSPDGFEFVYQHIKSDVHFNSLSGGTDINGCFVIGSPVLPVYAGELQSPALGMKVKAYDEKGTPIYDKQGELVCEAPAPSMPLYFWNDPDMKKYKDAYFAVYPNVWRHGDYIEFYSDTKGITFFGRSDAILKPSGVRIGTAEIYNIVEKFPEIADSVAIGQNWEGDQRVLLFVKLAPGATLTDELKNKIKIALRDKASPRHVPAMIIDIPDIPYTFNMKKVESAITNIVNGRAVTNRDALVNPQSLDYFEKILPTVQK
ncbi:MAG TPA: acetoacetate--CoA ligase [Deltaproteobacteria bacterium]|nr:acetoacetate--CoA ligase [Deltaproteobacteria bacterium]